MHTKILNLKNYLHIKIVLSPTKSLIQVQQKIHLFQHKLNLICFLFLLFATERVRTLGLSFPLSLNAGIPSFVSVPGGFQRFLVGSLRPHFLVQGNNLFVCFITEVFQQYDISMHVNYWNSWCFVTI